MKILLSFIICINYIFAIDIGTINIQNDNNLINQTKDIKKLLEKYEINLKIKQNENSNESINNIINNTSDNFFAIVNKDTLHEYNKQSQQDKSIYSQIPAILSLGDEQIHIFTNNDNEFDFDIKKDYKVYCEDNISNSCISARFVASMYELDFTFVSSSIDTIQEDLKSNKIDLFISVKKAPAKEFINFTDLKLIDLPTNFKMEDMYINTQLNSDIYSFLDENMHIYSVKQVLITNLKDKKYSALINNIVKIIVLNKDYLDKNNPKTWDNTNFSYIKYNKFLKTAKLTILMLEEQKKRADALKF